MIKLAAICKFAFIIQLIIILQNYIKLIIFSLMVLTAFDVIITNYNQLMRLQHHKLF